MNKVGMMLHALSSTFHITDTTPKRRKPVKQTCFRESCTKDRTPGKTYCSAECAKKDKHERGLLRGIKDESGKQ